MADYIDREALKEAFEQIDVDVPEGWKGGRFCNGFGRKVVNEVIDSAPSVNVEPVRHGRWEMRPTGMATDTGPEYKAYCTVCNEPNKQYQPPYCPHCGAKMGAGAGTVPVSALLELRDQLYENDKITMGGLTKLNGLIAEYEGSAGNEN